MNQCATDNRSVAQVWNLFELLELAAKPAGNPGPSVGDDTIEFHPPLPDILGPSVGDDNAPAR